MKPFYPATALLLLGLLFYSCRKDDKFKPTLSVDKTSINTTAAAGKEYFEITSNTDWVLSGMPEWLSVDPASGKGNARVELSYPTNTNVEALHATLSLKAADLTPTSIVFTQMGIAPSLLADKTTIPVVAEGHQETLIITSNVSWAITGLPAWVAADKTNGPAGVTTVKLTVAANTSPAIRKVTVTIGSTATGSAPVNVEINQAQPNVTITSFPANIKGGESITITGSGFSDVKENNIVKINDKPAVVTAASATSLTVTVPAKAGTGRIKIAVGEKDVISETNASYGWVWMVSDLAGEGVAGLTFSYPTGVAVDASGNVYVADHNTSAIYKITQSDAGVATGILFAGSTPGLADGQGTSAQFNKPSKLFIDKNGNIYVADSDNNRIRKITPGGAVSTIDVVVNYPRGVAVDDQGNIYASEFWKDKIIKITPGLEKSDFAFNTTYKYFYGPSGLTTDGGENLFIANGFGQTITFASGLNGSTRSWGNITTTTTQGNDNGPGSTATFRAPGDVAADKNGVLYVADEQNHQIRRIDATGSRNVTTFAGSSMGAANGSLANARFYGPYGVAVNKEGTTVYVCDSGNKKVRKIDYQ